MEIHPIKSKPSRTPPKIHIDQTSPFWERLRHHCHPPTTPNDPSPSDNCHHINSHENRSRTCKETSNQALAFPYTSKNTHQSNIAISEAIEAPLPSTDNAKQCLTIRLLPSTDNAKQCLTIRLLPPPQFLQKSLKNLQSHVQSSTSLPSHLPKYT